MNASICVLLAGWLLFTARPVQGQTRPPDLALATIEDLMNIEVTSASRKEQRAEEVPAAIYVITQDDIRRSGMTTIPDLLRLVPGVQVAQINANKWAVSVRGFNSLYSTKLLVLVDGRSIYNPLFATVLWDTEDLLLEDVERIEVIRGPGAAIWGANAVNGVINILTRRSADTQGLLVRTGVQAPGAADAAVRFGGTAAAGTYRVYAQAASHAGTVLADGAGANDRWRTLTAGVRGDWTSGADSYFLQADTTAGRQRPLWLNLDPATVASSYISPNAVSETEAGHVLGRWQRALPDHAALQLQSFADFAHRREAIGEYDRRTFDLDAEYHVKAGSRHDLVLGGGYRSISESMIGDGGYVFTPDRARTTLVNAFAQDEIALAANRVAVTLGAKFEHDTLSGSGLQPTARLLWNVAPKQHVWTAVSRALRTPSFIDRGLQVVFPPVPQADGSVLVQGAHGNPAIGDERLVSAEGGYRVNVSSAASLDVALFSGRYDGLMVYEPQPVLLTRASALTVVRVETQSQNILKASTRGIEISGRVKLTDAWQADGAVSTFHFSPDANGSRASWVAAYDGHVPAYQWRGHSAWSLGPRAQADLAVFRVGPIVQMGMPAYTRADARFELKISSGISAILTGQNLLDPMHPEFVGNDTNIAATLVPRSGSVRLTWRF
jgi:iron complex outermembrane receptor protein